jgi:hypothetical protein
MNEQTKKIKEFLALPAEALPGARLAEEDDAYAGGPWEILREAAQNGEAITALCGTQIVVTADRDEWRHGVTFA